MNKPVRVVLAEDEAIIRLDLKEILEEEDYEVVGETGRGDHAIDLVRKLSPDLAAKSDLARLDLNEAKFRWLLNEDAMATEKTAEGIRMFNADAQKLAQFIAAKL